MGANNDFFDAGPEGTPILDCWTVGVKYWKPLFFYSGGDQERASLGSASFCKFQTSEYGSAA